MKLNAFTKAMPNAWLPKKFLLVMKLTTFLLFITLLQVSAKGFSQKINLNETNAPLEKVLQEIRAQSGYVFFYNSDDVKLNVSIHIQNASIDEVLSACFKDLPIAYKIADKTILLQHKEPSFIDNVKKQIKAELAQVTVKGSVQDGTGQPMSGVTVRIKDTQTAVITDNKGNYSITVPDDNTILVFTYVGYESQELRAKDITAGSVITMKPSIGNLHEVVINKGYYNEKRELSTGDVSTVTAKEIEQQPVSNVLGALEGRVPGLVITQTTGLPGGGYNVQIRGQNSINNGNDPFYVVDGVPYNSQIPFSSSALGNINGALGYGSPLNYINPFDVESIEVLKDADATAIYGSRAANGAILITTKKGKAGKTKVDVNVQSGLSSPASKIQLLNTQQYLLARHEAYKNDGKIPTPSAYDVNGVWDTTRNTNWEKVLAQNTAHTSDAQISLSGGNTNTQFLVGAGYSRQKTGFLTLIPNDGSDDRASVHFNINHTSDNQKLKADFTGSYSSDINTVQSTDFTGYSLQLPPDAPPLFKPDGSLNWAPLNPGQAGTWANPLSTLYRKNRSVISNLVGNAVISYSILQGLEIKSNFGYTNTQTDQLRATPTTIYDPGRHVTSGNSEFETGNTHGWIIEPQIDYRVGIGKGILSALIGGSISENNNSVTQTFASGFISDALLENPQAAGNFNVLGSSSSQYRYNAVYGRLNYDWMDKYILNVTARRDGSSRFGPGKQFGDFGAVGAGWIFSKENFIEKNLSFLSFGKLKASYGTTGNDQIADYQFLDIYTTTYYPYQGAQGLYPQNLFNPKLAWEVDKKLEGSIELGFLKDRIIIQGSYYRNRSSNQLLSIPVSSVTGYATIPANFPATVQNSGTEFVLNTQNIKGRNFTWSSSFNLSINHNKLLAFPDFANSGYTYNLKIGEPITIQQVYHLLGVNPATGIYQFASSNGAPTYSPNSATDRIATINTAPKFYGAFQNSLNYKDFSLDFLFQFVKQTGLTLFGSIPNMPGTMYNFPSSLLNVWQKPGDLTKYQKLSQNISYSPGSPYLEFNYARQSDFKYGDASFIRLKNLSLSWRLHSALQQRMNLQNFRVFIKGQNLLTITNYNGIDPETQSLGTPPMRVWTIGIQAGL